MPKKAPPVNSLVYSWRSHTTPHSSHIGTIAYRGHVNSWTLVQRKQTGAKQQRWTRFLATIIKCPHQKSTAKDSLPVAAEEFILMIQLLQKYFSITIRCAAVNVENKRRLQLRIITILFWNELEALPNVDVRRLLNLHCYCVINGQDRKCCANPPF